MATNLEDKPTPTEISPKVQKKYSKRVIITIAAIGTLVMLVVGIAGTSTPKQRAASKEQETLTMASAQQALDLDKKILEAYMPPKPITSEQDKNVPAAAQETEMRLSPQVIPMEAAKPQDTQNAATSENSQSDIERDRLNQERAIKQQWLELQREAFLSSAATQGGNWSGHEKQSSPAEEEQDGSHRTNYENPYLEIYEKYLDYENKKAASSSNPSMSEKEQFFNASNSGKGVLTSTAQAPISPYIIPSGTMIPCNLVTGVNSDLPGYVVAQVAENVCDWKNPDIILIPQGTRVFGLYDSKIAFAQRRVQVSWSRLIYPDGTTLDLQGMPGADKKGYSGFSDKYYPRYGRLLTAAVMTAAFSSVGLLFDDDDDQTVVSTGGSTVVIPDNNSNSARSEFAREVADSIGNAGEQLFNKYLNTQPTILIRPAKRFSIVVNADIPFFTSYGRVR